MSPEGKTESFIEKKHPRPFFSDILSIDQGRHDYPLEHQRGPYWPEHVQYNAKRPVADHEAFMVGKRGAFLLQIEEFQCLLT